MTPNEDSKTNHDYPHHTAQGDDAPAGGYRVEDDKNLEEKDLKKTFLFGDSKDHNPDRPGYESHGMGGQSFGENNVTPAGDEEFNPSQSAGYDNDYFKRKEPMEEHPENNNFKPSNQEGAPSIPGIGGEPSTASFNSYQEGTADNDGKGDTHPGLRGNKEDVDDLRISTEDRFSPTAGGGDTGPGQNPSSTGNDQESLQNNEDNPGYNETPDQQKVGGANTNEPGKANYKPEYDSGTPDYGGNSLDDDKEHVET